MFLLRIMGIVDQDNKLFGGGLGAWIFGLAFIIMGAYWKEWLGMWMGIGFCFAILVFVNAQRYHDYKKNKGKDKFTGI